jgi:hypothetical protein
MLHFFIGFSKVLICGGYNPTLDTCEIIDLESSATTCANPPKFPATVYLAVGGLGFKENPVICGGAQNDRYSSRCYSLENNEWVSSHSMNAVRAYAAAAQLQDGKLLVTGGSDSSFLNSAEMLTENGWESNIPSLPVNISDHCMVTVNSTTVMAIGGIQNGQYSGKTFYFTFGEESWAEGPAVKNKRSFHGCGKIRRDKDSQEMSIIVAGGWDGSSHLPSVDILNEGSNEWQTGPELPFGIARSQMVEDQNGGVVLVGGESSSTYLDALYQLPHGGQDAAWTKMEQKWKAGRELHTAFTVPDNIVDCS